MGLRRLDLRGFAGDRRELADRLPRPVDEQDRSSDAVAAILEGYQEGLEQGGRPFVLGEDHGWLRQIAALSCFFDT